MKTRGFTLVELITTFALAAVIITILINVSVIIRDMYSKSDIRTRLLIEQANLSSALNTKINKKYLESYSACTGSSFCYNFTFSDGSVEKLIVTNNSIRFGNYTYKLQGGSVVKNPSISKEEVSDTSSDSEFLVIKIPITNKLYPNEDFGINLVYQYKLNYVVNLKIVGKPATEANKTLAGKVPTGNFNLGDEYIVNVDEIHEYHFYVLSTEGDKVNLIMSGNICSDGTLATETNNCLVSWASKEDYNDDTNYGENGNNNKGPITAMNYLYEATKNWSNIENIEMNYEDEENTEDYGYGGIKTTGNTSKITMKTGTETATYENLKARMIKYSEITGTGCTEISGSCPEWMVNGLNAYTSEYPTGRKEDISGITGYWGISSNDFISSTAREIYFDGSTYDNYVTLSNYGVRPVISILKSNL